MYDATSKSIASQLSNENGPLANIVELLGHSYTEIVEKTYADLKIETMRTDLAKLSLNPEKIVNLDE